MMNRRNFLQQAGLASAAMMAGSRMLSAAPAERRVGLQLYTLREYIGKDVKGVIARVAAAGYREVEIFGYSKSNHFWGTSAADFSALLKAHHITSPSGHYGLDQYLGSEAKLDDLKEWIEVAHTLGHQYLTVPYIADSFRKDADGFKAVAHKFNKAAALCKQEGLQFAYHNHAFEFEPVGGTTGYEILLKETDPSLVKFEMDIYWIVRGGKDPITLFREHPGRFVMWHVKDMDRANPHLNTEVGKGSIDYKKIFKAAKLSGVTHFIMEQENFAIDAYESITESCRYIRQSLLPVIS